MNRIVIASALLVLAVAPASAQDGGPPVKAPSLDMSRSVTLTGHELQTLMAAEIAQARAQDASQAARDIGQRVRAAMTAPEPAEAPPNR